MKKGRTAARVALATIVVAGGLLVLGPRAEATFHLIKVREVFAGTIDQPNAQFVELQMYSANQNFLITHSLSVYNATGVETGTFTFTSTVANGADQAYVLLATPEAEQMFSTTADLEMTPVLARAGGAVCWGSEQTTPVDCASWGNWSGDQEGSANPFSPDLGLIAGQSMEREIAGGSDPAKLDAGDDTNDSAADFQNASPSPTNNSGSDESPSPTPSGSTSPPPEPTDHDRSISLSLKDDLAASGKVSVDGGFGPCRDGVPVRIQKKDGRRWKKVKATSTNGSGKYSAELKDRPGTYRALAPAVKRSGEECNKATSPKRKEQ